MRIEINNKNYQYFSNYNITLKYNSIASVFSFDAKRNILDYFLEYPEVKIYDNELLLTGTLFSPNINLSKLPEFIKVTGYGKPGILEDCSIPLNLYPLQFDNLSLLDIADKILKPFGVNYNFTTNILTELNKKYPKIIVEPGTTPKELLNNLASQRGIYLTNNNLGELFFTKYTPERFLPVAFLEENKPGVLDVSLNINNQQLHSEITVVKEASKDNPDAGEFTIKNPYVDVFRPKTKVLNSGDIFDVEKAARMALSDELTAISFTIKTTQKILPGRTINLKSETLGIDTELFVEQTVITGTKGTEDNYVISCVLPEVYTDKPVKNIFK